LRLQLARTLGRSVEAPDFELARAAAERLPAPESEIFDTLQRAAQFAAAPKVPPKQALPLVRKLVSYTHQLAAPQQFTQEK